MGEGEAEKLDIPKPVEASRRDVIKKIEESGVSPADALRALLEEAQYLLSIRKSDLMHPSSASWDQKGTVTDEIQKLGLDPFNHAKIKQAHNGVRETLQAIQPIQKGPEPQVRPILPRK